MDVHQIIISLKRINAKEEIDFGYSKKESCGV